MVITVYISGISGNKEVKKRQQRVQMILESKNIEYEAIDIAEPGRQEERNRLKTCGATQPVLPPQMFNGDDYCGDYDQFDLSNENDELEKFLKLPLPDGTTRAEEPVVNNVKEVTPSVSPKEASPEIMEEDKPVEDEKEDEVEKDEEIVEEVEEIVEKDEEIEKPDEEDRGDDDQATEENDEE